MRPLSLVPLLLALMGAGNASAEDSSTRLGFMFNFSRFTEWPEADLPSSTFTFCLAPGDAAMEQDLATLEQKRVKDRQVKTLRVSRQADVARCQVLYLPTELPGDPGPWLAVARRGSTLTVSDRANFMAEGGIIGIFPVAGQYRFNINLAQARQQSLTLSSNLLRLAQSVK